jgi:ribosomal protein S18 acetylase RimI-like enzyme
MVGAYCVETVGHEEQAVSVRQLGRHDLEEAARLLGRGMRDNPVNARAFGEDPERCAHALTRFFLPVLRGVYRRGIVMGAWRGDVLLGVSAAAPPGKCQPGLLEKVSIVPAVAWGNPGSTVRRVLAWTGAWARRDPPEPHWHLGPVAVDAGRQGQGIGSALLTEFCSRLDGENARAYLETDKDENVHFYRKFGFDVIAQADVLGVPNWFMSRPPGTSRG